MKPALALAFIALLSACGADGAPEAPASLTKTQTGLTISGCVKAGIAYGNPTGGGSDAC